VRVMPYQRHVLNALMRVKPGILILVRDLSVPFGRRVGLGCQALVSAGYGLRVAVARQKAEPAQRAVDYE